MNEGVEELDEMGLATCPLITIAIPTFNRASWLKDCVLSALAQSHPRLEVLVSDNASTDETPEVLKQFADPRLRIVRQKKNIGSLSNWNFCLAEAKGEYVLFLSDDDGIAPHLLERLTSLIKREPRIPIVLSLCDVYDVANATTWPASVSKKFGTGIWKGTDLLKEQLGGGLLVNMCSILLRTDALRAVGGFPVDIPYACDMAAWAIILLEGRAGLVNESYAVFRSHHTSETSNIPIDMHIEDERGMMNLINHKADSIIKNPQERRDVKFFTHRYFARRIVDIILLNNEKGANIKELIAVAWRCRGDLRHLGMRNASKLAPQIFKVVLPEAIVEWIRSAKAFAKSALGIRRASQVAPLD